MAMVSAEVMEEVLGKTKRYLENQKDISDEEIKDAARRFLEELAASGSVPYMSVEIGRAHV